MRNRWIVWTALAALLAVATACNREGPAERAGKKLDDLMEKAKEKVERVAK